MYCIVCMYLVTVHIHDVKDVEKMEIRAFFLWLRKSPRVSKSRVQQFIVEKQDKMKTKEIEHLHYSFTIQYLHLGMTPCQACE